MCDEEDSSMLCIYCMASSETFTEREKGGWDIEFVLVHRVVSCEWIFQIIYGTLTANLIFQFSRCLPVNF